jgi:hypothetical protein
MPRKRRFKPSRKQVATVTTPVGSTFDDRREIHPSDVEIEHQEPARNSDQDNSVVVEDRHG